MRCKTIETSIFHVNNTSFTDPLIIGTFEKRASGHLLDLFLIVKLNFDLVHRVCHTGALLLEKIIFLYQNRISLFQGRNLLLHVLIYSEQFSLLFLMAWQWKPSIQVLNVRTRMEWQGCFWSYNFFIISIHFVGYVIIHYQFRTIKSKFACDYSSGSTDSAKKFT